MSTPYSALIGRIAQTLADVEQVVSRTEELLAKAQCSGDDGYFDGVALNLRGFYAGIERIFEDIARTVDQTVPAGGNWHQDVLLQMAAGINTLRPAVITRDTRHCLDEYRGFRHLVRNVYTFHLRASRLTELTAEVRACYEQVRHNLDNFCHFLEQLDDGE